MRIARCLRVAALSAAWVVVLHGTAVASHFRGGYIDWKLVSGNTVKFKSVQLFASADLDTVPINPGVDDSTIIGPVSVVFSAVDLAGQPYTMVQYEVDFTYPPATTFPTTAFLSFDQEEVNCCRLDTAINVGNDPFRVTTSVDLGGGNLGSPTSKIPMVLQLKDDPRCPNSIALPITDDGGFTCRLASDTEAGTGGFGSIAPVAGNTLAVSPGCVLSWDTTGTSVGDKYSTQIIIEETGNGGHMAVDLVVEIAAGVCPVCGDGVREGAEACDGGDDASCPGQCTASCGCPGGGGGSGGGGGGGGGCTGPTCIDSLPQCAGASGSFVLEVGQSFKSLFPASAKFTGFSICEDLAVNAASWGSLPAAATLESPMGTFIAPGTTEPAPTSGTCTHDGSTLCSTNAQCQLCSHDNTTICTSDAECDLLSSGSVCQCGVSSCSIPNNQFEVFFDWTPTVLDAAQTELVKITFTDPDFTVPGPLDYLCGLEIHVPGCGDDIIDSGEDCDGTSDAACPGKCRPPGDANQCTCQVCGDDLLDAGEQCDGTSDAACPGDCLASCVCAVCGDNSVNGVSEECDGGDDSACSVPGACFPPGDPDQCTCAVCGDNRVHPGIGEQCDGSADSACPGQCRPPGDADECRCAVCGDNRADSGEQCDGTSDAACPGACRPAGDPAECQCAFCGDDRIDAGEQCDGSGGGIFGPCPGECQSPSSPNPCRCPICGDGDVNVPGEQCDGADDAACPSACLSDCTCASCGDGAVNAPGEQCDGADDSACPGLCEPAGDPNQCRCPMCGDGAVNASGEQCDGADDSACPGLCRGDCLCSICGDNTTDAPTEQCDGSDDAACPGLCLPPGDSNQCQCPVCGDGAVNAPGEQCDSADDAACPGSCSSTCTCAVCGDGSAEAPAEQCDGGDDAACPGLCLPPGDANQCQCPVCGDGDVNQGSEICDGADAAACPSGSCASDCSCAVCGDDETNQPSEECDGSDASACDSVCLPACICAVCGDGDLNQIGEECDPPSVEICNNRIDDDGDSLTDCEDTDCPTECQHADGSSFPPPDVAKCTAQRDCRKLDPDSRCVGIPSCGADCTKVFACEPIGPDPSQIRFDADGPDKFKMHARFTPRTVMHPSAEGLSFLLTNAGGEIYRATLLPGDLQVRGSSQRRFRFIDKAAKKGSGSRDGLYKVSLRTKKIKGVAVWTFKIQAYGDFSAATLAVMTTQVAIGNDGTAVQAEWTAVRSGWRLTPANLR